MREKRKKTCKYLNYFENLQILAWTVTSCVLISVFDTLCVTISAVGLKICIITSGIKTCKRIKTQKKKKHNKIVLLGKYKLDTIEILFFKTSIDSYISHDEFVSVNNMLKEYNKMKEKIKNSETFIKHTVWIWLI